MIEDLWREQARLGTRDATDALRQVLDPSDKGGAKNLYLDCYLKHYLAEHLDAKPSGVVLEVGCGTGRLTEYLAPRVRDHVRGRSRARSTLCQIGVASGEPADPDRRRVRAPASVNDPASGRPGSEGLP